MPTRTRRGRPRVESAPQCSAEGRRAAIAPAQRERMPRVQGAAGACVVLAAALVERTLASPTERERAARRVRHARSRLVSAAGRDVAVAVERQLVADGGRVLRGATLGAEPFRQHALASATTMANVAAEHAVESTAGAVLLGLAARWLAVEHDALDAVAGATGEERDKAITRARYASQETRLALLGALALEREARQLGRASTPQAIDVAAAVAELERQALASAPDDGEHDDDDDEPPAGGDEHEPEAPGVGGRGDAGAPAGGAGPHARRDDP